jgi:hypothetical protein
MKVSSLPVTCFDSSIKIDFPFEKYISYILSIIPKSDLSGLSKILIKDNFSDKRCQKDSLGCYIPDGKGKKCIVEICLSNLIETDEIPLYLFNKYQEIAGLFLTDVISHEIGHHVHLFKRHGVKKKDFEQFAVLYSQAAYFNYFKYRKRKILLSYKIARWNIFDFDKGSRTKFKLAANELLSWYKENEEEGIDFP